MKKRAVVSKDASDTCKGNQRPRLKYLSGVWLGKTLMGLVKISGRGGTTLPGRTALKLAPGIISSLARQLPQGNILVTGTNGKTTTSYLLTGILKEAGYRCIHNQSGSNMDWGVATSLIGASTWKARLPGDISVMEVDEGAFPVVSKEIQPRGAVVTNIYRDQLDRYGEVNHIQKKIQQGLASMPEGSFQILNADDPSLVGLPNDGKNRRWYYGLNMPLPADRFQNTARDLKTCPLCRHELDYRAVYFAHLGRYRCPECDFSRPEPHVTLVKRTMDGKGAANLRFLMEGKFLEASFPLMGIYNLYNALAAVTCAAALGLEGDTIKKALNKAVPSFGRMERFIHKKRNIIMALIKNPVGANEVMRTLIENPGEINLLISINDKIADGTDISWLWDADFEQLSPLGKRLSSVVITGIRAWDMAVRLKYAGLKPEMMHVEQNTKQAVQKGIQFTGPAENLFILPTYTAMLEIRRVLNEMGVGRPYWEE